MNFKKISVIIPCYNVQSYVERCIQSIISNTYKTVEIICIDDGSTDDTLSLLNSLAEKDRRVTVVSQPNRGVSAARNVGLHRANGDYISFIDADDWVTKEYFSTLISAMENQKVNLAWCDYERVSKYKDKDYNNCKTQLNVDTVRNYWNDCNFMYHVWGRVYSAKWLRNTFFENGISFSEDILFNIKLLCQHLDEKCVKVSSPMYCYFCRSDSAVQTVNPTCILPVAEILQRDAYQYSGEIRDIFLTESIKRAASVRYLTMFEKPEGVREKCTQLLNAALKELQKDNLLSVGKLLRWTIFIKIPITYRLFRIITDRTMLLWERNQKNKYRQK